MTKADELLKWVQRKKTISTHEFIKWGVDNYYNRAERTKRDFVEQGLIRQLSPFEKDCRNITCKDAVYVVNEKAVEEYLIPRLF